MLPFKLVYHDQYDLNLGAHVFPSKKYKLIRDRLLEEGFAQPEDFVVPEPAPDEDILRVHDRGYITRLKQGTLDYLELARLEIPYSPEMVRAFWLAAGGTTLAARLSLQDGVGFNISGGFHHAFPDHGEGFCAIHDVAVAIRRLQADGLIERAMVIDTDVHHGNGTAGIFAQDPSVFTLSIHQYNNYPSVKPPSTVDINLEDGTGDREYLERLGEASDAALQKFSPQLLMYVAGADPYREDQLGGLSLSLLGLKTRDELVFGLAKKYKIPIAVTLAGGYARNVQDTVTIHANTAKAAASVLSGSKALHN
jgi:acetoin utilization deacetylase AcuC-like enzyme